MNTAWVISRSNSLDFQKRKKELKCKAGYTNGSWGEERGDLTVPSQSGKSCSTWRFLAQMGVHRVARGIINGKKRLFRNRTFYVDHTNHTEARSNSVGVCVRASRLHHQRTRTLPPQQTSCGWFTNCVHQGIQLQINGDHGDFYGTRNPTTKADGVFD